MADGGAEVDAKKAVQDVKAHVAAAMRLATTTDGNAVDLQAKLVPEVRHRLVLLFALVGRWHVLVSVSVSVCGRARVRVLVPYMRVRAGGCGWPYSNLLHWQVDRVKELLSTHTGALARSAGMNYTPKQLQVRWEKVHIASRITEYVGVWPVYTVSTRHARSPVYASLVICSQRMAACVQAINDALAEANPPQ